MKNKGYIDRYFKEMEKIIRVIPRKNIDRVIELLLEVWKKDGRVFIMGNGGSASTAMHFACDLAKSTIVEDKKRFKVFSLVDNVSLVSSWTNDNGFGSIFVEQLRPWLRESDILIGISVHGGSGKGDVGPWSQNLVKAMNLAKERKAKIIGFSGFNGGAMRKMADACITVPIDSEPLGTPLVESFHVVLHHLICSALRLRIKDEVNEQSYLPRP